ncbi:MAG TPA: hypothetical protein VHB18_11570 [Mycobacteriales bacterium]|jgi:hypothetical protein|nr:hypothetical protein [Mycobacteriales bacterium]
MARIDLPDGDQLELMERLSAHFDAGEIVELSLVIGKYLSQGRLMQVLGLDQTCSVPTGV